MGRGRKGRGATTEVGVALGGTGGGGVFSSRSMLAFLLRSDEAEDKSLRGKKRIAFLRFEANK